MDASLNAARQQGAGRQGASHAVVVAGQPIVGMVQDECERVCSQMLDRPAGSPGGLVAQAAWPAASVRHCLSLPEGEGCWDFYRPWTGLMLSVTDAAYRSNTWINVEGTDYFKLRILVSGTLRGRSGEIIARAPEGLIYASPGASREGYAVDSAAPLRMVVLHCRPQLLTQVLGLDPGEVPSPLDGLFSVERRATRERVALTPDVIQVARRIIDCRHRLSHTLRDRILQTLSMDLLLQVLGLLETRAQLPEGPAISAREAALVHQARDQLTQHYAHPPNIAELARRIGLNQTKLKEAFRQMFGVTLYEYILRLRMEHASHMLSSGDYDIAQVAYAVGYDYPANFTAAFKRHFGQLPRHWKRRQLAAGHSIPGSVT